MGRRKTSKYQKFLYILEYCIVVPLGNLFKVLPLKTGKSIAAFLAKVLYYFIGNYKEIAYRNLDIIFKDNPLPPSGKDEIIRKLLINAAVGMIEYFKIRRLTKDNYRDYIVFEGYDKFENAISKGKGLIVVTAHIGNWEYLASAPSKLEINTGVIINRQFNPYTDTWLRKIRENDGKVKCFYNEVSDLMRIVRHLKSGGVIGTLADQTYYFKPIFVPFFGIPSATADGPAKLHFKYGAPLMMAFSIRRPDGKYTIKFEDAVEFKRTDDFEADCKSLMAWINSRYEEYVRKYPDQWFSLLHDRWERTKPEDFADVEWDPY